jgi:hypothetical protein
VLLLDLLLLLQCGLDEGGESPDLCAEGGMLGVSSRFMVGEHHGILLGMNNVEAILELSSQIIMQIQFLLTVLVCGSDF